MAITFDKNWLRDGKIGSDNLQMAAHDDQAAVTFTLARTIALRHLGEPSSAKLTAITETWEHVIKGACIRAYDRVGAGSDRRNVTVTEEDFFAAVVRIRSAG